LHVTYEVKDASVVLALGDDWRVQPTDELIRRLERITRPGKIEVKYGQKARQRNLSEQAAS